MEVAAAIHMISPAEGVIGELRPWGKGEGCTALEMIIRGRMHFEFCNGGSPFPPLPGRKHCFFYFFVLSRFGIIIIEISLQGKMII